MCGSKVFFFIDRKSAQFESRWRNDFIVPFVYERIELPVKPPLLFRRCILAICGRLPWLFFLGIEVIGKSIDKPGGINIDNRILPVGVSATPVGDKGNSERLIQVRCVAFFKRSQRICQIVIFYIFFAVFA
jgi:hypothetical protein